MVKKYCFCKGHGAIPHRREEQVVSDKWQDDKRLTLMTQGNGLAAVKCQLLRTKGYCLEVWKLVLGTNKTHQSWWRMVSWEMAHSINNGIIINVFKTSLQDVFKTSSRRLGRTKIVRWRRFEDVFKTCLEEVFKMSSRPTDISWVDT